VRFAGADDYAAAIDARTGLVSVPMVAYRNARRLPVREVTDAAHASGARVLVDAYQAVGVEPVDVDELGCDYLVAGGLKYLLGLPGVAFLYARETPLGDLAPQLTGWFGRVDPFAFDPHQLDFPEQARRFETGTPAVPALYAANAGLALIGGLDLHAVRRHVASLVEVAAGRLIEQGERLDLPADPTDRGAHVALLDADPPALADWLARRRIAVSPRGDVVRLSFHYYSSAGDMELVCEEIGRYRRACL
jgi:selenocysteine lyase/cysteine desulfurase